MKTNGIEVLGQQIERLAKECKDYEISYRQALNAAKDATNAQWKAEQERDDAKREQDAAHSVLRMLRSSKKEAVDRLEKENERLIEEIHALNAKPALSSCKEGTWAWVCEMAFKNPGKIYGRNWEGVDPTYTMTTRKGGTFLLERNLGIFQASESDVTATDWREVKP